MKKILLIHDYPLQEGGGVEIQTYQDATALVAKGFSVCIASSRISSEAYAGDVMRYPQVTEAGVRLDLIRDLEFLKEMISAADVIHIQATFSLRPAMMGAMKACSVLQKPFIVTLHTNSSHIPFSALASLSVLEKEIAIDEFKSLISSDLCTIVGVSKSLKESLDSIGANKEFTIIHNARDWGSMMDSGDLSDDLISPVDVTYVGEISWMKGMHVLIGALTLLAKDDPNFKARMIGSGQDKIQVQAIIESLGLSANVEFISYVNNKDVPRYLARTSILVQPSLSEAWGNIVAESLTCGASVVVSDTEGLAELVDYGKRGMLFEKGNVCDLYEKLKTQLQVEKEGSLEICKKVNREYILERFSMAQRINSLSELYLSITRSSR